MKEGSGMVGEITGVEATSPSSKGFVSPDAFPDGTTDVITGETGKVSSDRMIVGVRDDAGSASSLLDGNGGDMVL